MLPASRRLVLAPPVLCVCSLLGGVAPATAQPPPLVPLPEARAALTAFLAERAAAGFSGVVLVARGDAVLIEAGYGFLDAAKTRLIEADSVFTTGSITKQFTAAAILKLEMQGRLSTSDPLSRHLPGVPEDKRAITLHHLLTHSAGFAAASGDDVAAIGRDKFVRAVLARPLAGPLGRYAYSNIGYSLLAAVIERATGQDYESFLAAQLFAPAGMTETGYARPRWAAARQARAVNDDGTDRGTFGETAVANGTPGWHLLGNGGIQSTVRDMFRWHRALAGTAVLNDAAKARLLRGWIDEGGGSAYGYGWSIEETPFGRLATHNGGNPYFFADFLRYLDSGVVVYYATNSRDRSARRLGRPLAQLAHLGRVLDAPTRNFGPVPAASPADALARRFIALLSADASARRAAVAATFSARLIARRGADALTGLFDRVKGDVGAAPPIALERATGPDGRVTALRLRYSGPGEPKQLILVVEGDGEAMRVDGIELEVG